MKNNPQLKSVEYQIEAAGFRASAAQALPAPTVGLEFSQIPTNSIGIVNDAISNNLSISQMFMLGGKLSAMSEMETRRGKVLEQNLGSQKVQLRAKMKMNYYQLWLYDRQMKCSRKQYRSGRACTTHAAPCPDKTECDRRIFCLFKQRFLRKKQNCWTCGQSGSSFKTQCCRFWEGMMLQRLSQPIAFFQPVQ